MGSASGVRARARVGLCLIVALMTATACARPAGTAGSQGTPGARAAGKSAVVDFQCPAVLEMTPPEAGAFLEAHGYEVLWRMEITTGVTGELHEAVSEVVTQPSEGVITDVAVAGGTAWVFVSPAGDPNTERGDETQCTTDR